MPMIIPAMPPVTPRKIASARNCNSTAICPLPRADIWWHHSNVRFLPIAAIGGDAIRSLGALFIADLTLAFAPGLVARCALCASMLTETVDWATSKPSIRSSPWIRDAPTAGFPYSSAGLDHADHDRFCGRPALFRDFQRQRILKPARCHRRIVSG